MKKLTLALCALLLGLAGSLHAQTAISLAGTWRFSQGDTPRLDDTIRLPGSMLTNGKGDVVDVRTPWTGSLYDSSFYFNPYMARYRVAGKMKFPFFLTPSRHYVGAAWYERSVVVPRSWRKRRVVLFLERPHIETTVWVNGREVGHAMSLSVPHEFDITPYVAFGAGNVVRIRVYNGIENVGVGQDSHSVTDQTQGNWNGIAGRMELRARGRRTIGAVQAWPDVKNRRVRLVVLPAGLRPRFTLDGNRVRPRRDNDSTFILDLPQMRLWSAQSPYVYHLGVTTSDDTLTTTFGMRDIEIRGPQMMLNGQPIWIRGTVENCCFPLTGYPPTDVDAWRRIFAQCKAYGLNAMRFHSYCPPEAAFTAADEMGFFLQPEGPSWPNHGVRLRRGMVIDNYLMDETRRIVNAYGNHPSFVMFSAGNEPAGDWVSWGNDWVDYWRRRDSRRVYCSFNVGGGWAWDKGSQYHVRGGARGLDWDRKAPQCADDYEQQLGFPRNYKGTEPNREPIVAHEQGQWCAFPDLDERAQYTGAYKAANFDIFADLLRDHGMAPMARRFLMASGRLQVAAYKYEIERNLRTPSYAGFMLLGLNDYSGQGTALVGPLNVFWREKGYVDSTAWRQFCAPVVAMAELPKFVFAGDERAVVPVDVYQALEAPLGGCDMTWRVEGEGEGTVDGGRVDGVPVTIAPGKHLRLGRIVLPTHARRAVKRTLHLSLRAGTRHFDNSYDYWVYPDSTIPAPPGDIYVADSLSDKAVDVLRRGGKVLLTAAGRVTLGSDVSQHYLPVFWNTSWFKMRPPHTTGASIDTAHPLFRRFPSDDWANLNWWELLNRAQVMNLTEFPADYQPPIQPIDTWHVSRKLGMLVEANVLGGRLVMTTMDVTGQLDKRPVAREMLRAIIGYMESDDFRPSLTLEPDVIGHLFTEKAPPVNMYTNDSPDELKPKLK